MSAHADDSLRTTQRRRITPDAKVLRLLYQIHWVSAAVSLVLLLLFALTGITMNHAAIFKSEPVIIRQVEVLPDELLPVLAAAISPSQASDGRASGRPAQAGSGRADTGGGPKAQGLPVSLPAQIESWLGRQFQFDLARAEARLIDRELRITWRQPGRQHVVTLMASGVVTCETTQRGWLAYLMDLHKGKSAGDAWRWFIDIFAFGVLVFGISGLWILKQHAPRRRGVWPAVALGMVLPMVVVLLFVR